VTPPTAAVAPSPAVAAIDCGTNSTRLLVADANGRQLVRLMRITRLGQGVDRDNRLAPDALDRTVGVLEEYRRSMDTFGVARVRMVATSAVRDADNGTDFSRRANAAVGIAPEVLSGQEEGELAFRGASADLDSFDGDTLVVDIGGGSTELVLGRDSSVRAVSLQLGCVRLTERFLISDPPPEAELASARAAIARELDRAQREMPQLSELGPSRRLIGLAGTVSTLTALYLGVPDYDPERLHHARLPTTEIQALCAKLAGLPARTRAGLVGMVPGREDVIVGGALVLEAVAMRYGFDEVVASEHDILDGIIASLLEGTRDG
jgi:exopolyphosphatase/guanosine-5'-triphosphate,3'-diphosphate pyrophosphatase